jgi:hypothetical protein
MAAVFYVFASLAQDRAHKAWLLGCFVLFSGWDIIGQALANGIGVPARSPAFPAHLENWNIGFQYSSHVTQIFWVPNHAIAGWACVAGYLYWRAHRITVGSLALMAGLCAMWSPLAILGALPFLARAAMDDFASRQLTFRSVAAPILAFGALVPVLAYLLTDSQTVPKGFFTINAASIVRYLAFVLLEALPFLLLLCAVPLNGALGRTELAIVAGSLLLIPFYDVGAADFVMRASIPALAILALMIGNNSWPRATSARALPVGLAIAFLAIGAVTPVYEIGRALVRPSFAPSRCDLIESRRQWPFGTGTNYLARTTAGDSTASLFALTGHAVAGSSPERCWPDRSGGWVLPPENGPVPGNRSASGLAPR